MDKSVNRQMFLWKLLFQTAVTVNIHCTRMRQSVARKKENSQCLIVYEMVKETRPSLVTKLEGVITRMRKRLRLVSSYIRDL
jgi:hypothetical protein